MHARFKSDILSDDGGCFNLEAFSFILSMTVDVQLGGILLHLVDGCLQATDGDVADACSLKETLMGT